MFRRAFGPLLAVLIGCGPSSVASESEATEPGESDVEDVPGELAAEVVTHDLPSDEPADEREAVETLRAGAFGADSTLCTDSSAALHALMPEAFEPAADGTPPTSPGLRAIEDDHPELPAPRE